jgi:carboxymethylenebutenolidase
MSYRGISTEVVKLTGYKNDDIEAYVSKPDGDGPFPGICIIHHMPGWDEWTLELCWKFANRGFAVIAPHLYSRFGPGDPDDVAARARGFGGMTDDQVVGDVDASSRWLRSQSYSNGKVGVIGFCSGGRQTFLVACRIPEAVDAAVDCWGGGVIQEASKLNEAQPVSPITLAENLRSPLMGVFGNDDENPTPEEVDQTEAELKRLGKTYEFYRYDGASHAFWSTDRYRYRPEQAVDSFNKTCAFFARHLQSTARATGPSKFIGPAPKVTLTGNVPLRSS